MLPISTCDFTVSEIGQLTALLSSRSRGRGAVAAGICLRLGRGGLDVAGLLVDFLGAGLDRAEAMLVSALRGRAVVLLHQGEVRSTHSDAGVAESCQETGDNLKREGLVLVFVGGWSHDYLLCASTIALQR